MIYTDTDGGRIASEAFGTPRRGTILLIAGATASMVWWPDAMCRALAARGWQVIRYDHRDTGESATLPPGEATYSAEDLAADALAVLDAHGVERAHLVGMSLGGYLGQMLALDAPERVASLTLYAAEPLGWDGAALPGIPESFMAHFGTMAALDWADATAVRSFLLEIARLSAGRGAPFDEGQAIARVEREMARTSSMASAFNHASMGVTRDWSGAFRRIAVPVLVLHGADDPLMPPENGRALAAGIDGARLVLLEGVGHELTMQAAGEILEEIDGFARAAVTTA